MLRKSIFFFNMQILIFKWISNRKKVFLYMTSRGFTFGTRDYNIEGFRICRKIHFKKVPSPGMVLT